MSATVEHATSDRTPSNGLYWFRGIIETDNGFICELTDGRFQPWVVCNRETLEDFQSLRNLFHSAWNIWIEHLSQEAATAEQRRRNWLADVAQWLDMKGS